MYVGIYVYYVCDLVCAEARRGHQIPWDSFALHVCAGHGTLVPCKSSKCSRLLSCLSSLVKN